MAELGNNPRVCILVLDGVGIGGARDAAEWDDEGADTLRHILACRGRLHLPNLAAMGLGELVRGISPTTTVTGSYGVMEEASRGKDTTLGHWELAGLVSNQSFPTFPHGFPDDFMRAFEQRIGRRTLCNMPASGTAIIEDLGPEHQATGCPIVYTSADSVFQVAAHEEVIPPEELYGICRTARLMLKGNVAVARVIARPFTGSPGCYKRTDRRRDFSLDPPGRTILDAIWEAGMDVVGIGKIEDIFAGHGITRSIHTHDNDDGVLRTIEELRRPFAGLLFTNLVDFDSQFGHRRDVEGFGAALERFDGYLPELLLSMGEQDTLIITADHGNDPTHHGTDHTRERVPLLAIGRGIKPGSDLGVRRSFTDVSATVADLLGICGTGLGSSFARCADGKPRPGSMG